MSVNEHGMSVLLEFVERYGPAAGEQGPELFVYEVLGVEEIDPWQLELLRAYGRGERRISVRSCHGPGKTALTAWLILYQLLFRFPQKTIATAPTRGQLFDALFAEVMTWFSHMPKRLQELYNCKSDRIEMIAAPDESFFSARTARRESPEALQGVHSDHVLLIADEASGVDEAIYEAAVGSMSGDNATTLLCSNPVRTSGFFFDTHHKLKDMWFTVHVGADDSPRVTEDFKLDVARRYGEDSNAYRVRVLGEFPKADDNTIIPFELVESAAAREIVVPEDAEVVWGLDVARFGDDVSCLTQRSRYSVDWENEYKNLDLMALVGRVHEQYNSLMPSQRPTEILVDVIGVGAGVVDRLRELGLPARGINVGESASMKEAYMNLRAELWFKAREWLEEKACTLGPNTEILRSELVIPRYDFTSSGKIQAEAKSEMKKRGHKSPNHADAFVLTFASNALRASRGRKGSTTWDKPVKRGLPGIV
jgi:phage terminase large subunit